MSREIKNVITISIVIATVSFVGACGGHEANDRPNGISAKGDNTRLSCGDATLYAENHGSCDAMDVSGEGACFCLLGYYWDGQQCTDLSGACECVGSDCGRLSPSREACEAQHSTCDAPIQQQRPLPPQPSPEQRISCGDEALFAQQHDTCDAMNISGEGACFCHLGYYWDGQRCTALDGVCECVGSDCDRLSQSLEACLAQHATCS